ncbi:enoyl-CoA hydratase/carnithine racemase [Nitrospirillum viridazoti Y2]|uniref:Enoyl-CoA hydratase/carnithine racemase n=1 Tax=Nitrospirillum amazonense TaxID=28077 RepID=A0A560HJY5_9PROT|nr:enoyl-CoA hydratase/isomerase family protein [Nitrospirillum amazonense]EGY02647.1 enoyl-CoA hydratase/carnithine racemase [Nitrospirillum amazonense Y2]TWB46813.1 enoyl-CoA hydratase/carnithine racemase [Nitrospirillum amazonense]
MFHTETIGARFVLTLDRPPVNAINDEWLSRFHAIVDELETRQDVAVVHVRSAHKVFCAGMDIGHIEALTRLPDGAGAMVRDVGEFQRAFTRLESLPQVVLAELGGAALGGGLELALACDLRIAADEAKLGLPEAKLGLIPGAGGTQRLTWLCGKGVASRLILSGEVVNGQEALKVGLVQWSVPRDRIANEASLLAERIASLSIGSLHEAKRLISAALTPSCDGFAQELEADRRLFDLPDTRARIAHFLQGGR